MRCYRCVCPCNSKGGLLVFWGERWRERRCVGNGFALSSSQIVKVNGVKGRGPTHLLNECLLARPISPAGQVKQASGSAALSIGLTPIMWVICEHWGSWKRRAHFWQMLVHRHVDGSQFKLRTLSNVAGFGSADSRALAAKVLGETVMNCAASLPIYQEFVILSSKSMTR